MLEDKEVEPKSTTDVIMPAKAAEVQIITHRRDFHVYMVSEAELDELASGYNPVEFGLFTLCIGIFFSFLITLVTADLSNRVFAASVAILVASVLGIICFGIRAWKERQRANRCMGQIKKGEGGRIYS